MSLKIKFFKQIFPPLVLSIFLTATISTILIIVFHFSTISQTKDAIILTEHSDLTSFAQTFSDNLEENLKPLLNDITMVLGYAEYLSENSVKIPSDEGKYIISAYDIANRTIVLENLTGYNDFKGYDNLTLYNYDYAMWYIPGNQNLTFQNGTSQDHFNFFSQIDVLLRSIFRSNPHYKLIFGYFEDDGFQYKYPSYEIAAYLNFTDGNYPCDYYASGKSDYYDMRCRIYGKDIKKYMKSPNLNQTFIISEPYLYLTNGKPMGVTFCGYNLKNSTSKNFSLIPPGDRKLNNAICLDYEIQDIVNVRPLFEKKQLYFFIMYKDSVFYHPNFQTMKDSWNSITEFEFNMTDKLQDEESLYFNRTVISVINSFYQGANFTNSLFEYKKKGVDFIATVSPIHLSKTGETGNFSGLVIVVVEPKNLIFERFDNVAQSSENYIIVQVVIFMVIIIALVGIALILINFTVKHIITPISDLLDVVQSMLNDDMELDVTKNYTPNSEEIDQLYQSFSKLKFIMKYANEEFFSGNDAQALINYSNALKLYLELNQKEGIGITYNNIGNIHLKNERYEEAIACYRAAVNTIEQELDEIYKENLFRQTIFIKNSPTDLESQEDSKKIYLPKSRRRNIKLESMGSEKVSAANLKQLNEMYSNRMYQLATTLYKKAVKVKDKELSQWDEIITIFKKIIDIDSSMEFNNSRIIQCLIYIANCFMELGDQVASLKYLHEAESSISIYERVEKAIRMSPEFLQNVYDSDDTNMKNSYKKISDYKEKFLGKADILKQDLMYHYGIFYKKVGKCKLACAMLTKSIETGKIYDPSIRKKCLELLSSILARQNLLMKAPNVTNILARMDDVTHKDIVFLLDYSESMGKGARIQYAIRNFAKIFDKYIQSEDRICFMRFNLNCEIVFELTPKKINTFQLRLQIQNSLNPAGKTAFYDALGVAIQQFPVDKDYEIKNKRRKWIVSLTDGEDNSSQETLKNIKTSLKASEINLIIVGMGLSKNLTKILKDLCKSTKDGAFIESPNNDDLDVAFEAISQIIYGENLIVESFF